MSIESITTRQTTTNTVHTTRHFSNDILRANFVQTSSKVVDMNDLVEATDLTLIELNIQSNTQSIQSITTTLSDLNDDINTLDNTMANIMVNTALTTSDLTDLSLDVQTQLIQPLYDVSSLTQLTLMTGLTNYISTSISTSMPTTTKYPPKTDRWTINFDDDAYTSAKTYTLHSNPNYSSPNTVIPFRYHSKLSGNAGSVEFNGKSDANYKYVVLQFELDTYSGWSEVVGECDIYIPNRMFNTRTGEEFIIQRVKQSTQTTLTSIPRFLTFIFNTTLYVDSKFIGSMISVAYSLQYIRVVFLKIPSFYNVATTVRKLKALYMPLNTHGIIDCGFSGEDLYFLYGEGESYTFTLLSNLHSKVVCDHVHFFSTDYKTASDKTYKIGGWPLVCSNGNSVSSSFTRGESVGVDRRCDFLMLL